MRLSKINLAGFKSFVDPTTAHFPTNLTSVVGPNGCGKSNIIDAVRWVMGESSAKNLRGDSMTDVIFNGSTSRKPVGQATIELVFDNSKGSLGGEYAAFNEISTKRLLSRDGQSQYFLNGSRCRRRDITDIFLGTGLGPRSYAIIEQGTISRIIEAKPEDLRIFLEEAAGISKYKERRRETETRLRHTRENMDRLEDLRQELGQQLERLQRQAANARRYKALREEERKSKGNLLALNWQKLDRQRELQHQAIIAQETTLGEQYAIQRKAEAEIEQYRQQHSEYAEDLQKVQGDYYLIGSEIARLEQSIEHSRERFQQQQHDLAQIEQNWGETQQHQQQDEENLAELQMELEELDPQQQELTEIEAELGLGLAEDEEEMQEWQQQWDQFNQQANQISQNAQVERARIQQFEQQTLQLEQRMGRIKLEMANLTTHHLDEELQLLAEEIAIAEISKEEQQERVLEVKEGLQQTRERVRLNGEELESQRGELHQLRGRHSSLQALQQAALGQGDSGINRWLEEQQIPHDRRLAEMVHCEFGWEGALESVLGENLQAVPYPEMVKMGSTLNSLKQGEITLIDSVSMTVDKSASAEMLRDKVDSELDLSPLLAGIYLAEDLDEALQRQHTLGDGDRIVTRSGDLMGRNWCSLRRGGESGQQGILHRQKELEESTHKIEQIGSRVQYLEEQKQKLEESLHQLEQQRDDLQSEVEQRHRHLNELQGKLRTKEARHEQINHRRQRLEQDLEELNQQLDGDQMESETSRTKLHAMLEEIERYAKEREVLQQRRERLQQSLEGRRSEMEQSRRQLHQIQLQLQGSSSRKDALEQAVERSQILLEQLAERRQILKEALVEGEEPIELQQQTLQEYLEQRIESEQGLEEARKAVEIVEQQLRKSEQQRMTAERQIESLRSELEQKRLQLEGDKTRLQTLLEQIEGGEVTLKLLIENLEPESQLADVAKNIEQIGDKIRRLGAINLAAIEEYEQQLARKTYLDEQNDDLEKAIQTLESAIHKIDRETKARFKETFELVNHGLQQKFPRLFGGGHAYLELTSEDLLNTGVTVMARPPGKRNSTIHLLSGGEKAMTAVALVFSIFELNPAPFCMLDEVDAPLDEANVGRFCQMVKEMSEQVQFIFITHNKTTMEMASTLSGVTMHEPGVSRLVAVDVDEAVVMAGV